MQQRLYYLLECAGQWKITDHLPACKTPDISEILLANQTEILHNQGHINNRFHVKIDHLGSQI